MKIKRNHHIIALLVILLTVSLDQWTKTLILEHFTVRQEVLPITSFFDLILIWNHGVSFGLFNTPSRWNVYILSTFALAISLMLLWWIWKAENIRTCLGFSFIVAGAIGNVIDRLRFSAVIDFLHFHWQGYAFPTFNIADTAITIGVAIIIIDGFLCSKGVFDGKKT